MSEPSVYIVTEGPQHFRLQLRTDGAFVRVERQPTCLVADIGDGRETPLRQQFGFYEYARLTGMVAQVWMQGWQPPASRRSGWRGAREWARNQIVKALRRHMHAPWQRLIEAVNPQVLAVHKALFAATFSAAQLTFAEALYREPYLVRDILHYRAAAMAVSKIDQLGARVLQERVRNSAHLAALEALAKSLGVQVQRFVFMTVPTPLKVEVALDLLKNWRGLFAPDGAPYRSLNRTLMNLPGGVPAQLLCRLAQLRLPRPLLSRTELLVALLAPHAAVNQRVFLFARPAHIKRALQLVSAHVHQPLSARGTADLAFLVRFLADYPEQHHGNLVGLAKKSIRWHRQAPEREVARLATRLGPVIALDTPVARPPMALPAHPGVRFLATVGEIVQEGALMQHCIVSYVPQALAGRCYLFHVEHKGQTASVMVDARGRVVQAHGPHNRPTPAAVWGRRVLGSWGRELSSSRPLVDAYLEQEQNEAMEAEVDWREEWREAGVTTIWGHGGRFF
jgi:hypothetical protein